MSRDAGMKASTFEYSGNDSRYVGIHRETTKISRDTHECAVCGCFVWVFVWVGECTECFVGNYVLGTSKILMEKGVHGEGLRSTDMEAILTIGPILHFFGPSSSSETEFAHTHTHRRLGFDFPKVTW
jgi:hypothetical protein